MPDQLIYTIILAVASILSGVIGALIMKYGLPFSFRSKEHITFEGVAKDIVIPGFEKDFSEKNVDTYEFKNGEMIIDRNKADIKAKWSMSREDGKIILGDMRAKGKIIDGIAYLIYEVKLSKTTSWNGVLIIQVPKIGFVSGYWLTEKINEKGVFVFGQAILNRL